MTEAATSVAVIGLGIMGGAIASNLLAAGFEVSGFDIDQARTPELKAAGAVICGSAAEAARGRAIAFTSLPSVAALEMTVENLLTAPQPGLVVIEVSTFPLEAKQAAQRRLQAAGMTLLDCPLSGTGAQAATRDLAIYASGDKAAFDKCAAAFAAIGRVTHYLGEFGNGTRMKFVANLLVSIHNVAAAEAMVLGAKAGLDPARIVEVIGSGAGNSRILELRGPMMAKRNYRPATAAMHVMQKDSAIIAEYARSIGVPTPLLDTAAPFYDEAEAQGHEEDDVGAVHEVLARRAGL